MFWDFLSLTPESIHQVTILFSDRGTPDGYRHMNGYSSHTLRLVQRRRRAVLGAVPLQDGAGHQEPHRRRGRRAQGERPRLRHARPLRGHRARRLPVLAARDADHAGRRGRDLPLRRLRHHQGLAARRLPADRPSAAWCWTATRRTTSPRSSRRRSTRATSSPASALATTRCCRRACSATTTRTSTGWARNYHLLPVNAPKHAPERSYQRDGFMRVDANGGGGPELLAQQLRRAGARPERRRPGHAGERRDRPHAVPAPQRRLRAGRRALPRRDDRRGPRPPREQHRRPPRRTRRSASACASAPSSTRPTPSTARAWPRASGSASPRSRASRR